MLIGVPKEIKPDEYRVALTPAGAEMLSQAGHEVVVEKDAGVGSGFTDDFYEGAGATILDTADEVWAKAAMIARVTGGPSAAACVISIPPPSCRA